MSIYDYQSEARSQTAELQLREENMSLRMEIIKLKKALYLKASSQGGIFYNNDAMAGDER